MTTKDVTMQKGVTHAVQEITEKIVDNVVITNAYVAILPNLMALPNQLNCVTGQQGIVINAVLVGTATRAKMSARLGVYLGVIR